MQTRGKVISIGSKHVFPENESIATVGVESEGHALVRPLTQALPCKGGYRSVARTVLHGGKYTSLCSLDTHTSSGEHTQLSHMVTVVRMYVHPAQSARGCHTYTASPPASHNSSARTKKGIQSYQQTIFAMYAHQFFCNRDICPILCPM